MRIGPADTERQVAIIAEIGNNHEGDLATARDLVRAAAGAGAHAVKFQAIVPADLVGSEDAARVAQLERLQLTAAQFAELAELAHSLGIGFVCTPFSLDAVGWLAPLVDAFKVASGDNDYVALLERIGATGRPTIVSSGMTDLHGLRRAQRVLRDAGAGEVAVLHCVSAYPTAPEAARLAT
ncbi:MAG: N-acetylneuraminate synthase family protein, partial [Solirubrobacteraceae bacterium]